jgi:hypothetical protein
MPEQMLAEPTEPRVEGAQEVGNGPESVSADQLLSDSPTKQMEAPAPKEQVVAPAPSYVDEQKLQAMLNPLLSELGGLRKMRSDFDSFRKQTSQPQNQPPKSWEQLDEPTQKATRELIKHLVDDLYKEKFESWESTAQEYKAYQENSRIENSAKNYLGADFDKYNEPLGNFYLAIKQKADMGDPESAGLLQEIRTTRTGIQWMCEEVKKQVANSQEAKAAQVQQGQAAKVKSATTALGNSQKTSPQWSMDNLPVDRAERMKVVDQLLGGLKG